MTGNEQSPDYTESEGAWETASLAALFIVGLAGLVSAGLLTFLF